MTVVLFFPLPPAGLYVDALDRRRDGLRTGLVPAREAERQVPEEVGPDLLGLSERAGGRRGRAAIQRAPDAQAAREPRRLGRRARQWRAGAHQRGSSAPADAFVRSDQSARACALLRSHFCASGGGKSLIGSSPPGLLRVIGVYGHGGEHADPTVPRVHEQRPSRHHRFAHTNAPLSFFDDVLHSVHFRLDRQGK